MISFLVGIAAVIAVLVLCVLAFYYVSQRAILFPAPKEYASPEAVGLAGAVEDPLITDDGETVMVWSVADGDAANRPVLVYFHGNGDSLPAFADRIEALSADGWHVVAATYRGYPGSTGKPSEAALVADAIAVFDRLLARDNIPPANIVLYGFSLGSAVAMGVAEVRAPGGLVLEGAMHSIVEVGKHHLPWLPVRTFMRDQFKSADRAAHVTAPSFLIHGTDDEVIPLASANALLEALPEPKEMFVVPGGTHVLPPMTGWPEFLAFARQYGVTAPPP